MNKFEQKIFVLDCEMNDSGIPIDVKAAKRLLELSDYFTRIAYREAVCLTGGISLTQVAKLLEWVNANSCLGLENLQAGTVENTLRRFTLSESPKVRRVLELRKQVAKASVKKLNRILACISPDDTVKGCLRYCGTTTGRWSATSIQPQNFIKPLYGNVGAVFNDLMACSIQEISVLYENPLDAVASCMRSLIKAPEGYEFVVADYSQIEQRVLAWIADDTNLLDQYGKGFDPYVEMAKSIFPDIEIKHYERELSKQVVLGAGFGMWTNRFVETCGKYGIEADENLAAKALKTFRNKHSKIVAYWDSLENLYKKAISNPGRILAFGHLRTLCTGFGLFVFLPSGRYICYPYAKLRNGKISYYRQIGQTVLWDWKETWHGQLIENLAQAIARDVLAQGMVNANENGYKPVFTVHDELISMVPKGSGDVEELENSICGMPSWADGLPLKAEGYRSERYKKG
mgnify:CR=1 FL=1